MWKNYEIQYWMSLTCPFFYKSHLMENIKKIGYKKAYCAIRWGLAIFIACCVKIIITIVLPFKNLVKTEERKFKFCASIEYKALQRKKQWL